MHVDMCVCVYIHIYVILFQIKFLIIMYTTAPFHKIKLLNTRKNSLSLDLLRAQFFLQRKNAPGNMRIGICAA